MVRFIQLMRSVLTDFRIQIGNIEFKNPIFTASGTFGYGNDVPDFVDVSKLGGIVTKSITLHPREGNPPPRIVETPSGMLNSIGLANVGVDHYMREMVPSYSTIGTKIIMNIAGSTLDEYIEIIRKVESISSDIAGYEINISCPNVKKGGMEFGVDRSLTAELTRTLRILTDRLLIVKLSPNVTDIAAIAAAAEDCGADAVSAINTVVGMSINPTTWKSNIYTVFGGLSGPATKPIGLAAVQKIFHSVKIPIIGIGGITNSLDVIEYFLAGASAVQLGTVNYQDPSAGEKMIDELETYCKDVSIDSISSLVGKVKN